MLPFEGGITGSENGTLILAVLLAVFYLFYARRRMTPLKVAVKTLSVTMLAGLSAMVDAPWMLTVALVLCAIGDFLLALEDFGERFFLSGLVAFLLGHIMYISLFTALPHDAATLPVWMRTAVIAVMIFVALAMTAQLYPAAGDMRWPVLIYIMVIVAMGSAAVAFGGGLIVAGAVAFMASDSILATERFLMKPDAPGRAFTAPAVWITYFAAQVMILFGVLATMN